MSGHSKKKGGEYERQMCRRLSLWVSNRLRQDCFWRTAMSGGRATLRSKHAPKAQSFDAQCGDVSAIHPWGHLLLTLFMVECKYLKELQLNRLCFGLDGLAKKIWLDPRTKAWQHKKEPLICAKENMRPEIMMTTLKGWRMLHVGARQVNAMPRVALFDRHGMHVFLLKDLLADIDFNLIRKHHGEIPIHGRSTPDDASA